MPAAEKIESIFDFSEEFLQGQRDCKEGIPHQAGRSESYDDGYSTQYTAEQMLSELTKNVR